MKQQQFDVLQCLARYCCRHLLIISSPKAILRLKKTQREETFIERKRRKKENVKRKN